jgi:siroheme synthase-like protein
MKFLPLGIDLREAACTVVGGGAVATRKVLTLLRAGAEVTVVSPKVTAALAHEIESGRVRWRRERFAARHVAEARLVVMATEDAAVNAAGVRLARERLALVCDASSARRTGVIFGALLERDGMTIAAFTDGVDPARSRRTRNRIAELLAARCARRERPRNCTGVLLVLVAHGSRNPRWSLPLQGLAESVRDEAGDGAVRLAYSQFASPTLAEVVAEAARSGVRRVRVLPLFMTRNGHVERDIRPQVEALRNAHEDVEIELLPPIAEHASFRRMLVDIAKEGR